MDETSDRHASARRSDAFPKRPRRSPRGRTSRLPSSPAALVERAHIWRPWRAYAVQYLCRSTTTASTTGRPVVTSIRYERKRMNEVSPPRSRAPLDRSRLSLATRTHEHLDARTVPCVTTTGRRHSDDAWFKTSLRNSTRTSRRTVNVRSRDESARHAIPAKCVAGCARSPTAKRFLRRMAHESGTQGVACRWSG